MLNLSNLLQELQPISDKIVPQFPEQPSEPTPENVLVPCSEEKNLELSELGLNNEETSINNVVLETAVSTLEILEDGTILTESMTSETPTHSNSICLEDPESSLNQNSAFERVVITPLTLDVDSAVSVSEEMNRTISNSNESKQEYLFIYLFFSI